MQQPDKANEKLTTAAERALGGFNALSGGESKTHVWKTEAGKFRVAIETDKRAVHVKHDKTYHSPGTIDLKFVDKLENRSYVIFMTECDLKDFPQLLRNALSIPRNRGHLDHVMEGFRTSAMYSSKSTGDMPLLAL